MQCFTPPAGLREGAGQAMDLAEVPTGLISGPTLLEVAYPQPGHGQVIESAGTLRIDFHGLFVGAQSLVNVAEIEQRIAAIGGSGSIPQCLGAGEDLHSLPKPALVVQNYSMHVHRFCIVGSA